MEYKIENEDRELRELVGSRNPFTVPEGFFDKLQQDVMASVPEVQKKRTWSLKPWLGVAASVCILFVAGGYFYQQKIAEEGVLTADVEETQMADGNDYYDEASAYIMMDNDDLYTCLMEN